MTVRGVVQDFCFCVPNTKEIISSNDIHIKILPEPTGVDRASVELCVCVYENHWIRLETYVVSKRQTFQGYRTYDFYEQKFVSHGELLL